MQPTSTGNQDTNENIKIIQQPQQYIKTFFFVKVHIKCSHKEKSQADVNNNILLILKRSKNVLISTFKYKRKSFSFMYFPSYP